MSNHSETIESEAAFTSLLNKCTQERKLLLVDFYTDWCGPCRAIAPYIDQLCTEYSPRGVVFAKINMDNCRAVCVKEFVSNVPTFKLYKNGESLVTVVGADLPKLRQCLVKYASSGAGEEGRELPNPIETALSPPNPSQMLHDPVYMKLVSTRRTILSYLDPVSQALANSLIPTEKLIAEAAEESHCEPQDVQPRAFLRQLLRWFKEEFFKWAGDFNCDTCGTKMNPRGRVEPTTEELSEQAFDVELYTCPNRHSPFRFARINDPKALLRTRLGRCGEWANCLTLCLVSVLRPDGNPWFPACRFVLDWTDHVWCEVWLEDAEKPDSYHWTHCDPGGEVDQPLLYENGWGKRLNYIFAYTVPPRGTNWESPNAFQAVDIQDVTWRYTRKFAEVCSRRDRINESRLATYLSRIHLNAVQCWSSTLQSMGLDRNSSLPFTLSHVIKELASLFTPPPAPEERLPGRKTGPLEWRRARGELGADDPDLQRAKEPVWHGKGVVLKPTDSELKHGVFYIRYNSALDIYDRPNADSMTSPPEADGSTSNIERRISSSRLPVLNKQERIQMAEKAGLNGWQKLANRWTNITRKVEHDWQMAYLARDDDNTAHDEGIVEWHFELDGTEYEVDEVSLFANMVSFKPETKAHVVLCSSSESEGDLSGACFALNPGDDPLFSSQTFKGAKRLHLTARLWTDLTENQSPDPLAWQHAQLFRQKTTDEISWSFELRIKLIKLPTTTE